MNKKLDKNKTIDTLKGLYGDEANGIYLGIENLIEKYQSKIKNEVQPLNEKDAILITYGDNVQQEGVPHLKTLKKFVDTYCLPEINSTHILPCFPYTSDDGFSVTDYYEIDPDLGTWKEIGELAETSSLMFDAVVNHMSKSSQWFQSYLAQEEDYKDYFIAVNPEIDLSKVVRPRALPLLSPFKLKNGEEKHIWTTFSEDQVDLNFESPKVFLAILDVLLHYTAKGAKFIRLDAIAFLWKEIGTNCIHLEQTHTIIKLYKEVIQTLTSNLYLITETNVPHKENISYFGNGEDEADLVYNFTLAPLLVYSVMKEDVAILTNWASSLQMPSNKVCFFNFTASHDGLGMRPLQGIIPDSEILDLAKRAEKHGGQVGYKNNEDGSQSPYELNCNYLDLLSDSNESDDNRVAKMMITQSLMVAFPGVPGIYFHSLVGSRNYYKGVEESGIKRRINREKLNFNSLEKELNEKDSLRNRIYSSYKKILSVRSNQKAFNPFGEATYAKLANDKVFVIKRVYENDTIYAIYNFSSASQNIKSLSNTVFDLFANKDIKEDTWKLKPLSFYWLKVK
ncbi:alpha-amylase family glycosyl hydrolase [Mariniflexile soesokkakense]|uniref:Alpha-amylase family glycosyl hydrolase n=1 Tax=Mariniflexile soesokkakense TaxID=1343160 RepID=A0ABV0AD06_9FLAO